jgi:hypothetical protein
MPVILSGRYGFIIWAEQTGRDGQLPSSPDWKPFGIVRDVSVRVPAGTALLRSVGILAAAGIAVVETALEAPEITVTVEGVGMATKEVFLKAKQLPSNDPNFPNELPYLSVVFGRADEAFRLVDAKVSRLDITAAADRYVTATITLMGRWIESYTKPSTLPDIPIQIFTSKEGTFSYGEVAEARVNINHRIDARHTIKTTSSDRPPDYLVEVLTEITGTGEFFWQTDFADFKENVIDSISSVTLTFVDWANSNNTMTITLSNVKPRDATIRIPVEREITVTMDFFATNFTIT